MITAHEVKELLDRARRIETRLTAYMASQGFDTQVRQPIYDAGKGVLTIPSRKIALQDCLDAIGPSTALPVRVYLDGEYIVTLMTGA